MYEIFFNSMNIYIFSDAYQRPLSQQNMYLSPSVPDLSVITDSNNASYAIRRSETVKSFMSIQPSKSQDVSAAVEVKPIPAFLKNKAVEYFENNSRSGGGPITSVDHNETRNLLTIFFENHSGI